MWLLFDDAREGGAAPRLYREPAEAIVAHEFGEIDPALERIRGGLRAGRHAAGYLAYEAGYAFDPRLEGNARRAEGPLLCFGLFEGFETPDIGKLLASAESAARGAQSGPQRTCRSRQ